MTTVDDLALTVTLAALRDVVERVLDLCDQAEAHTARHVDLVGDPWPAAVTVDRVREAVLREEENAGRD